MFGFSSFSQSAFSSLVNAEVVISSGVAGTSALGTVTPIAASFITIGSVSGTISIGTVTPTVALVATGVTSTGSIGSLDIACGVSVSGTVVATGTIGAVTAAGVQFDFEAVKENYDIGRVVYVKAQSTSYERTINVKKEIRLTFVARQSTSDDRTIRVAQAA